MKRLSLLVAILLIATIGGVYAAWTYIGGNATAEKDYSISMGVIKTSTESAGVYTVTSNVDKIIVEPTEDKVNYVATLDYQYFEGTGDAPTITLKFTPSVGSVYHSGIKTELYFAFQDYVPTYDGSEIFAFTYTASNKYVIEANEWTDTDSDGVLEYTLTLTEETFIMLSKDFNLNTKEKAQAFAGQLKDVTLYINSVADAIAE